MTLGDRFTFGKYAADTVRRVIDVDKEYIKWAFHAIDGFELDDEAMYCLARRFWHDAIVEEGMSSYSSDTKHYTSTGKP